MEKHVTINDLKTFLAKLDKRFVRQKAGFGLSSNDFEDKYKERLKTVENDAEKNVITSIELDEETLVPDADRIIHIEIASEDDIKKITEEGDA